jgi:uncharacterized protein YkwD
VSRFISMNRPFTLLFAILLSIGFWTPATARADLVEFANQIRARGCGSGSGVRTPLKRSSQLDAVAREWSRGGRLRNALTRADYRAVNSTSMHISGSTDDGAIATVLRKNYCSEISTAEFQEIGLYRSKKHVWLVLATPFSAPTMKDAAEVRQRVLQLVNQARARERKCGRATYRAVPPLTASAALDKAAQAHAADMAKNNWFEHEGTDGSTPAKRVERQGYRWATVGENVAAGAATADDVVKGWLESPGHCTNIMGAQYRQMGIAYVVDRDSKSGIYWSQVFATPR